jgi:hypothetical protein
MKFIKNWWKFSTLRFYYLNLVWNYYFWLTCEKKYKIVSYYKKDFFSQKITPVKKKKFEGYLFKGELYLDNPGPPNIPHDVYLNWKKKKLL